MQTIVLASASPQRSALLAQIRLPYMTIHPSIEESADHTTPGEFAAKVAGDKARAVYDRIMSALEFARKDAASDDALIMSRLHNQHCFWILGADTVIDIDGEMLGKPGSETEARGMIERLSGREHEVITAMTLIRRVRTEKSYDIFEDAVRTRVRFAELSADEIDTYIASGDWRDAAGAYHIQSLGALLVECIHGSYTNVVGLPLRGFYGMLRRSGFYLS